MPATRRSNRVVASATPVTTPSTASKQHRQKKPKARKVDPQPPAKESANGGQVEVALNSLRDANTVEPQVEKSVTDAAGSTNSKHKTTVAHDADSTTTVVDDEVRSVPKSGRWWKTVEKNRNSKLISQPKKAKSNAFTRRREQQVKIAELLSMQKDLKEESDTKKQENRARLEKKKAQKLENERRGEVVVKITDTRKLKKMSRKQLRMYDKR